MKKLPNEEPIETVPVLVDGDPNKLKGVFMAKGTNSSQIIPDIFFYVSRKLTKREEISLLEKIALKGAKKSKKQIEEMKRSVKRQKGTFMYIFVAKGKVQIGDKIKIYYPGIKQYLFLKVVSIGHNNKPVESAFAGEKVAVFFEFSTRIIRNFNEIVIKLIEFEKRMKGLEAFQTNWAKKNNTEITEFRFYD
jgi:hypothetical protein